MSQKQTKKFRKEVRREITKEMGEGIATLQTLVRERPTWCPRFVWIALYMPIFKRKSWKFIYKNL
ncbi:MAG: hypothetical protein WC763_04695 [Candidatus Paceibacterota bacterium]|jgi:hypothetical protein